MLEGYEYDSESEGMRDALERAREKSMAQAEPAVRVMQPSEPPTPIPAADAAEPAHAELLSELEDSPVPPPAPPEEPWARMKYDLQENKTRVPPPSPLLEKMKEVGWEPKGTTTPEGRPDWSKLDAQLAELKKGTPPPAPPPENLPTGPTEWEGMQKNIQSAEHEAETKRTIAAMLHAAAPGFVAPANAGEGDVGAAKSALEVAIQKQHAEQAAAAQKREQEARLLTTAREQAQRDPNSPESKRARDALRPVFEMVGKVPEGFETWSAHDVETHAKTLAPIATTKEKERAAESDKEKTAAAKKEESDKKAAALELSIEQRRGVLALDPRWKEIPGLTAQMISKMGAAELDDVQRQLDALSKKKAHGTGAPAKPVTKLEDIPDMGTRREVDAILNDRQLLARIPARGGEQERIRKLVHQIDPNYDETKAQIRYDLQHQQALAPDTTAMGIARHHLKLASDALPDNADTNFINRAKQAYARGSGDPEFTKFTVASTVAAHEVAKVMKIDTEGGKAMVEHMMEPAQSRAQLLDVFATIDDLIAGKQSGMKEQLDSFASSWRKTHGGGASAPLQTRKTRSGGTAYLSRKTAGLPTDQQRWFTTPEEAEAN